MSHNLLLGLAFLVACAASWFPGNKAIWYLWVQFAKTYKVDEGTQTPLAGAVGGLERVLYIYCVIWERYELITGWLVMKAFFNWIGSETHKREKHGSTHSVEVEVSNKYNGFILGTLLSLLLGLAIGHAVRPAAELTCSLLTSIYAK